MHSASRALLPDASLSQGGKLAIAVHVGIIALWTLFNLLDFSSEPEIKPHIFTLSGPVPASVPAMTRATAPTSEVIQAPQLKAIAPPAPLVIPEPLQAQDRPKPQSTVKPIAEKKKADAPAKPIEKPASKAMTYEEFTKTHKKTQDNQKKKPSKASSQAAPRVNAQALKKELAAALGGLKLSTSAATGSAGGAGASSSELGPTCALDLFNQNLLAKIDSAWIRPAVKIPKNLSVSVQFRVAPSGLISEVKILKGSGNTALDASVQEAFARIGNAGVPPDPKGGIYRLTFLVD